MRMQHSVMLKDSDVLPHKRSDQDIHWTQTVKLELVPHPVQPRPEIAEMVYGMTGGMVRMKLRAATAGYILRKWSVDCAADHSLRRSDRLWLKDHLALFGVKNAVLAPGYTAPEGLAQEQLMTKQQMHLPTRAASAKATNN